MKEYNIEEIDREEIIISFLFDKTSTVISFLFSILLIALIFLKIKASVLIDKWGYIVILFILLLYLTFNKYYEWNKNKYHKLTIKEEDLYINNRFYCTISNIKSINISYSVNQFESGWTVYLYRYLNSRDYIIKRRLKEKDAYIIAEKLADFLGKTIVKDN
ncbi:hypothetical protein [Flavobacterium cerinum]|uniref:YcxB family protein n=1 Tax=Flavobacterium cerinum TaxID=2502784 RepID=A0ABY5IV28_9FLAO|nr:hypothetical protein [Flavobacterium cerinum]UUC46499.1 hypothetical protein NOX80_04685 [Flavobacterium cerinum]